MKRKNLDGEWQHPKSSVQITVSAITDEDYQLIERLLGAFAQQLQSEVSLKLLRTVLEQEALNGTILRKKTIALGKF